MTDDLRKVVELVNEAKRRNISVIQASKLNDLPVWVSVVLTDKVDSYKGKNVVNIRDTAGIKATLDRAIELHKNLHDVKTVTIAIDPGKRCGVAYLVNDVVIRTETYLDKENMVDEVKNFIECHPKAKATLVVGNSDSIFNDLEEVVRSRLPSSVRIVKVAEDFSTKILGRYVKKLSRDEASAVVLAQRWRNSD